MVAIRSDNGILNFYPRPPRGGRLTFITERYIIITISIHALREEGDRRPQRIPRRGDISIHALREEGDCIPCAC